MCKLKSFQDLLDGDLLDGANWRHENKIKGNNNVMYNIKIKEIHIINKDFKLEGFYIQ